MRRRSGVALALGLALAWALAPAAAAQQILLDRGARVGELWVFPAASDPKQYYYVPARARLVEDESGRPRFSFLRYVINRPAAEAEGQGITDAEGGGILHFLVTYDTPLSMIRRAEAELKQKHPDAEREEVRLRGPVLFEEGRYALVSSIVNDAGEEEPQLLAAGNAPVFEGSQIALSFDLSPERATLLLESLKMATPDISLVFEMTMQGLTDAFDADLVVNWSAVNDSNAWEGGGNVPGAAIMALTIPAGVGAGAGIGALIGVYGAGVGAAPGAGVGAVVGGAVGVAAGTVGAGGQATGVVDELFESKAVELRTRGTNENMEALLEKAYERLINLLFEEVEVEPEDDDEGMFSGLLGDFVNSDNPSGRKPVLGVGLSAGYRTRAIRKSGVTVLSMKQQTSVERVSTIAFNVGDLWTKHGDDPAMFKTVNLADPAFQQREIHIGIDGAILPEFKDYINSVTTTMRKRHQNGKTTVQEIVIDADTFNAEQSDFRMIYGWNGDDDRDAWLEYEYQTRWSFKGGGEYETGWTATTANMIDLYAPYRRKVIKVLGDAGYLLEQGVRAVVVYVDYPFFDGRKRDKLRLRPDEQIENQTMEITLPLDEKEYHYKITWIRSEGGRVDEEGSDSTGILFVDEPPATGGDAS